MIERVLIANRGEIALRIARTCRRLGISTVAVFSDADAEALHVAARATPPCTSPARPPPTPTCAPTCWSTPPAAAAPMPSTPATASSPNRPRSPEQSPMPASRWIGPPAEAIEAMGNKIEAKALMRAAGVPILLDSSTADYREIGVPLLVKAAAGGGGRGMRVVRTLDELDDARAAAEREAAAAFGDGTVFYERYVERGRHVEIQVLADAHGTVTSLHERECSIQRRHQKIIEESPSPAVDEELRGRMADAAIAAAKAVGYVGAGTVEFLLEPDGRFWFLEMNTRLQVEHPVTELVTGLDLVELQLAVADGAPLPAQALDAPLHGHAIEARLTAEDPAADYRPSTGRFTTFEIGGDVRIDTGVATGSTVSPYYDSMVAKVIAHGPTRDAAIRSADGSPVVGPAARPDDQSRSARARPAASPRSVPATCTPDSSTSTPVPSRSRAIGASPPQPLRSPTRPHAARRRTSGATSRPAGGTTRPSTRPSPAQRRASDRSSRTGSDASRSSSVDGERLDR